jgi:hypothetical protein
MPGCARPVGDNALRCSAHQSTAAGWPMISTSSYSPTWRYLSENTLRRVMDSEVPKLMPDTTLSPRTGAIRSADTHSMATEPTTSSARHRHCTKQPTIKTATSSSTCLRTRHQPRWPRTRAYPEPVYKPTDPMCGPCTTPSATLSTRPLENKHRALTATSAPVPAYRPRSAARPARSRHPRHRSAQRPLCRRPRTRR